MQWNLIFVAALCGIVWLTVGGCSTQSASKANEQTGGNLAQVAVPQETQNAADLSKQESDMDTKGNVNSIEYTEPVLSDKLSHDLNDADGKTITQVEYRYVSQEGDFLSVVASIRDNRRIEDIQVTEKNASDAQPKIYKKGSSVPEYEILRGILYDLNTYQKNVGLMTWINAPERANWKNDASSTWVIVHYGDIQYVVSSRQDLPEERYEAFNRLYTYLTSFVSGFDRKMKQNIGEPAAPIVKTVHGKEVRLVPGTGNSVLTGAEIDYGDKKWWIEEEFNATFTTTPDSLKLCEGPFRDEAVKSADITIDENGNFVLHINQHEFVGSLGRIRKYAVWGEAYYAVNDEMVQNKMKKKGYLDNGQSFSIDYAEGDGYDDKGRPYRRLELRFRGEPYVHGRGAIEPNTIVMERK